MFVYLELVKMAFLRRFMYRGDTLLQIVAFMLRLFIFISIWQALFQSGVIAELSLVEMFSYLVLAELLNALSDSRVGAKISESIGDGSVIVDFIRPLDFKLQHFASDLGENLYRLIFNALPTCILVALVWGFKLPSSPLTVLLFLPSLILGVAISFHIDYLFALLTFWVQRSSHFDRVSKALFMLFSGTTIPLWFYPDGLREFALALPFSYITFQPLSIYLEKHTPEQSLIIIAIQAGWLLALVALSQWLWFRAQQHLTINGG